MPCRYSNITIVSRLYKPKVTALNNFAISSGGIGEAMERSASSLMAANNTIDESIALITAANLVVQDPAKVGKCLADVKSGYIG